MGAGARLDPQRAGAGELSGTPSGPLDAAAWARLREAFDAIADLPETQRERRIAALALDPPLETRLRGMLAAHAATGVLDREIAAPTAAEDYASLATGTMVGDFQVERLIGRGGMGEVYLATRADADFAQRVALKLLRPEVADCFLGFVSERRLLANLEHPGIARFIDGGVAPDGRPFMAMEYVDGVDIVTWCRMQGADLPTRLKLFGDVCASVGYAHGRLVIHRDIKPANILVDGSGRVRLLDFGIARLVDQDDAAMPTEALFTPQYAAPEQLAGEPMTVATDVYALGAVLYELVAGHGPWRAPAEGALPTVFRRLLRDDPPPPSTRATEPLVPAARITGDLDAIALKALRHAPADRYPSVEALAADIGRYQAHLPVAARAGAAGYRVRQFVRRNRWGVAAAAVILLAILGGLLGTAWQARQAARERDVAVAEAERTEAVNQAMMLMFRDANDAGKTDSITARELIASTAQRLVRSLDPRSPKSAAIVAALSDLYLLTEDLPAGQALLEGALARGVGANDAVGTARLKLRLAQVYAAKKRIAEGRQLLAAANTVWAADPERYRVERAEAASAEAYMLRQEGNPDEGIALLQRTMPDAERAYGPASRDLATRYANLATHLVLANRLDEAAATITRAEAVMRRADMMRSPAALTMLQLRGSIAARRGDIAAAEPFYRRAAAERRALYGRSYSLAVDLLQEGRALNQLGRPAEGLRFLDEAQPMAVAYAGATAQPALLAGLGRAESLALLGRLAEARAARDTVAPAIAAEGEGKADFIALALVTATIESAAGQPKLAERWLDRADAAVARIGAAAESYRPVLARARSQLRSGRRV